MSKKVDYTNSKNRYNAYLQEICRRIQDKLSEFPNASPLLLDAAQVSLSRANRTIEI